MNGSTMLTTRRLPKSIRKYIRQQKAKIRREILDPPEQKKKILELRQKFGIVKIIQKVRK